MPRKSPRPPRKDVHVEFTPEDHALLVEKAAKADLSVSSYVRRQALDGQVKVKVYSMQPLNDHTIELGNVVKTVRRFIETPNPYRWMYEADIERIEGCLKKLVADEQKLREDMTRRLKR